jgi:hypothetical protein
MVASCLNCYDNYHFKLNYEGNICHILILQDLNGKLKLNSIKIVEGTGMHAFIVNLLL